MGCQRSRIDPLTTDNADNKHSAKIHQTKDTKDVLILPSYPLHNAAKIGDQAELLMLLLSQYDPFQRDSFQNIPLYYCSLFGHIQCATWLLISMKGLHTLTANEIDRLITNALTREMAALMREELHSKGIIISTPDESR